MILCILLGHKTTKDNPDFCLRCGSLKVEYEEEDIEWDED